MEKSLLLFILVLNISSLFGFQIEGKLRNEFYYNHYREGLINYNNLIVNQNHLSDKDYNFSQFIKMQEDWLSLGLEVDLLMLQEYEKQKWENNIAVKEAFFQRNLSDAFDLKVGRFIHQWGTGYAYNPTNFVAPAKNIGDLENDKNLQEGKEGIALEYFGLSYSFSLCYFTSVGSNFEFEENKLACRFYKNIENLDVSLLTIFQEHRNPGFGANFSTVLGDRLELHGEASLQRGSYRNFHEILIEQPENQLFTRFPFTDYNRDSKSFYGKYLLGFQYTFSRRVFCILEYYHQDEGYSKNEWEQITGHIKTVNQQMSGPMQPLATGNLLWNMNIFSPKGSMRDYLMNYFEYEIGNSIDLSNVVLFNILDQSFVLIPEIEFRCKHYLKTYIKYYFSAGKKYSEFGGIYQDSRGELGLLFYL